MIFRAEEAAARLLVERHDLHPPVDVLALLKDVADVQILPWSFDCDGLVVGLTQARPKAFVRANVDARRQRFTMGHELGHIMLGWHTEVLACHLTVGTPNWLAAGREAEASRFASALLVPDRYLSEICAQGNVTDWFAGLAEAGVSAYAGVIALARGLPPGWLFVVELPAGPEDVASAGTRIRLGWVNGTPDYIGLVQAAEAHGAVWHQGRRVRWYRFVGDELLPEPDDDPRSTTELLRAATTRAGTRNSEGRDLVPVVNGVISAAVNAVASTDPAILHATILFRIKTRKDLQTLIDDVDFRIFIARKARELGARRAARAERRQGPTLPGEGS